MRILHINGCRESLMSGRLLEDENDIKELSETFKNVYELSLGYNRFLSDALFNRLVAICPNLESLSLMGCQMTFHYGLYGKFYPDFNGLSYVSRSTLTFINAFDYFEQQAYKLKHLNFSYTLIDPSALAVLSGLKNLRLESLILQGCDQLSDRSIIEMTRHQTCLKVLDISFNVRITDYCLFCICTSLTKLETLRIKRCRAVTDTGVKYIRLLKNLKELNISEGEQLTDYSITRGLCSGCNVIDNDNMDQNIYGNINFAPPKKIWVQRRIKERMRKENMRILSANALRIHEESVEYISKCFPNLRQLELSYCFSGVTDKTIQVCIDQFITVIL